MRYILVSIIVLGLNNILKANDSIKSMQLGVSIDYLRTPGNFFGIQLACDQSSVFFPESKKKHKLDYTKWYNRNIRYSFGFSYDLTDNITGITFGGSSGDLFRYGIDNIYYFENDKSFIGLRPDIGISYKYFELYYGYCFPIYGDRNKYDKYISRNSIRFSLLIPIYMRTRNINEDDGSVDSKKKKRKKR